jgi:hypothetical protein
MNYRKLTPDDYLKAQGDLSTLTSYYTLVAAAQELYGPRTHKVEVELDGDYNDEGGTSYRVTSMSVTGKDGEDLPFDLTTPFWVAAFAKDAEYAAKYDDHKAFDLLDYDEEDLQYSLEEHFSDDISDGRYNIHVDSYDSFDFECIVGQVPDVQYKELYVLED